MCYGEGGNGKSKLLETVSAVLADYAAQGHPKMLMEMDRDSRGPREDIARLHGARFVPAIETGAGKRLDEVTVKTLTGGDKIVGERKWEHQFEFAPTHKLWLACNYKPEVRGRDTGIWRRIKLVPFLAQFPEGQRDEDLPAKLWAEREGILSWLVEGALKWQREGLAVPVAVREATDSYRDETDALREFLDECTVRTPRATVRAAELYAAYQEHCKAVHQDPWTQTTFGRAIVERGFPKQHTRTGWEYRGIGLVTGCDGFPVNFSRACADIENPQETRHNPSHAVTAGGSGERSVTGYGPKQAENGPKQAETPEILDFLADPEEADYDQAERRALGREVRA